MDESVSLARSTRLKAPPSTFLSELLAESSKLHRHLCPRQVLGVRIGLYGLRLLGFVNDKYLPRYRNHDKRLLTIVETDGCSSDGIAIATDCAVGHRSLRVLDYGKVAATLVDTYTEKAIRVIPAHESRQIALTRYNGQLSSWHAYLEGYQIIPDHELLEAQQVTLTLTVKQILSRPSAKVNCEICGEEIFNEREIIHNDKTICRSCNGESYYSFFEVG